MTPHLIVYITRPEAYEVYMGGKRHLDLWLQEPHYDHRPKNNGLDKYVDTGWQATHCSPQPARHILKQDDGLLETVMEFVAMSLYPKGMDLDKGTYWADKLDENGDHGWRTLFKDQDWEGKCNTCHKRFLLKVDLRTNRVERIQPYVILDGKTTVTTDECTPELATQYYHDPNGVDIIPF